MSKFIVEGGNRLHGQVRVQGSKNAAFPVMAAAMLSSGVCVIDNVPDISDVRVFLELLGFLGAKTKFSGHLLTIDARRLENKPLPRELVGRLRGSILFAGALLARFHKAVLPRPGGDAIGVRPIDVHLDGFRKLGARVRKGKDLLSISGRPRGEKIVLRVRSVTGTENLILASVLATGTTEIEPAAAEPHVQELCRFLNKLGAKISGIGTSRLVIRGVKRLRGGRHRLPADEIVAVTWCVAAAVTRGELAITGVELKNLAAPLVVLERMGVNLKASRGTILVKKPKAPYKSARITTGVFPRLLTDMQPLLGVLATQSAGETTIHEWFHEGRQEYLRPLKKMGAKVRFEGKHQSRIAGPTALHGADIRTPDLRAGASVLIAALVAKGRSTIYNAEIIDRGYERIDDLLKRLGAKITRI